MFIKSEPACLANRKLPSLGCNVHYGNVCDLKHQANNRFRCAQSGVGRKAEKTNTREDCPHGKLAATQMVSSTRKPHSASPIWIPQELSLLQPDGLGISVSSDVGGEWACDSYDPAHSLHCLGNSTPPREAGRDWRVLGTQRGECGWRLRGFPSAHSSGVPPAPPLKWRLEQWRRQSSLPIHQTKQLTVNKHHAIDPKGTHGITASPVCSESQYTKKSRPGFYSLLPLVCTEHSQGMWRPRSSVSSQTAWVISGFLNYQNNPVLTQLLA